MVWGLRWSGLAPSSQRLFPPEGNAPVHLLRDEYGPQSGGRAGPKAVMCWGIRNPPSLSVEGHFDEVAITPVP